MKVEELLEEAGRQDVTYSFWVDNQGNLLLDINDKEELEEYIKRKATELNNNYKSQLNGSDISKLSLPEIINRISWFYVRLYGFKQKYSLYDLDKKQENIEVKTKELEGLVYDRMKIRTDLFIDTRKNFKNKIIDKIVQRIVSIYPSIKRVKVIGANDNSTEFYL